jgi:hypothetical protein
LWWKLWFWESGIHGVFEVFWIEQIWFLGRIVSSLIFWWCWHQLRLVWRFP